MCQATTVFYLQLHFRYKCNFWAVLRYFAQFFLFSFTIQPLRLHGPFPHPLWRVRWARAAVSWWSTMEAKHLVLTTGTEHRRCRAPPIGCHLLFQWNRPLLVSSAISFPTGRSASTSCVPALQTEDQDPSRMHNFSVDNYIHDNTHMLVYHAINKRSYYYPNFSWLHS